MTEATLDEHLDDRTAAHFAAAGLTAELRAAYREHIAGLPRCGCGQPLLASVSIERGHCEACRCSGAYLNHPPAPVAGEPTRKETTMCVSYSSARHL